MFKYGIDCLQNPKKFFVVFREDQAATYCKSILSDLFPLGTDTYSCYRFAFLKCRDSATTIFHRLTAIFTVTTSHTTLNKKLFQKIKAQQWVNAHGLSDFFVFTMYRIALKELALKKSGLAF